MKLGEIKIDYVHDEKMAREALKRYFHDGYFDSKYEMEIEIEWHDGRYYATLSTNPTVGIGTTIAWAICDFIKDEIENKEVKYSNVRYNTE